MQRDSPGKCHAIAMSRLLGGNSPFSLRCPSIQGKHKEMLKSWKIWRMRWNAWHLCLQRPRGRNHLERRYVWKSILNDGNRFEQVILTHTCMMIHMSRHMHVIVKKNLKYIILVSLEIDAITSKPLRKTQRWAAETKGCRWNFVETGDVVWRSLGIFTTLKLMLWKTRSQGCHRGADWDRWGLELGSGDNV